jgi:hypothetical protein
VAPAWPRHGGFGITQLPPQFLFLKRYRDTLGVIDCSTVIGRDREARHTRKRTSTGPGSTGRSGPGLSTGRSITLQRLTLGTIWDQRGPVLSSSIVSTTRVSALRQCGSFYARNRQAGGHWFEPSSAHRTSPVSAAERIDYEVRWMAGDTNDELHETLVVAGGKPSPLRPWGDSYP